MDADNVRTFTGITPDKFAALNHEAAAAGITIKLTNVPGTSPSGVIDKAGALMDWEWDGADSLIVTVLHRGWPASWKYKTDQALLDSLAQYIPQ